MARACSTCAKSQKTIMTPAPTDGLPSVYYNCHAEPPFPGRAFPDVQASDWCWQYQEASALAPLVVVTINV